MERRSSSTQSQGEVRCEAEEELQAGEVEEVEDEELKGECG